MSNPKPSKFAFFLDLFISLVNVVFGRLLPVLKVPASSLDGKTAIVTGGNSGIGFQTALKLARRHATVYLACRNIAKAKEAVAQIVSQIPSSTDRVKALILDTSSLDSVRKFAADWGSRNRGSEKIDLLFHNAGIASAPAGQDYTTDGFPLIYATNFLGSFLLTFLLEAYLATDARIILTSSTTQYGASFSSNFSLDKTTLHLEPGFHGPYSGKAFPDEAIYANTKAMQVAFAKLLQRKFEAKGNERAQENRRMVHAFAPGFTSTSMVEKTTARSLWEDPVFWILKAGTFFRNACRTGSGDGNVVLATTGDKDVVGRVGGGAYWDRITRRFSIVDVMEGML